MGYVSGFQGLFQPALSVAIANAATKSAAFDCGGMVLCGIKLPAAFTGTVLTFEVSDAIDGTFQTLYQGGSDPSEAAVAVSIAVAQGRWYAVDPKFFYGVRFLKIVSGSTEGGARTLVCQLRG